mgnify:CR=1 FL=1
MDLMDLTGLMILATTWGIAAMFVCAVMERQLRKVGNVIRRIERDNEKYVM